MLPQEKLSKYGPTNLRNNELLAVILRRGNKKENIFRRCQRIMRNFGNEGLLTVENPEKFAKTFGVTQLQASQIIASLELGRRLFSKESTEKYLTDAEKTAEYLKEMKFLKKEHVRGLFVNVQNKLIHEEIISIGSLSANIVHPREVFQPAILHHAYGLILAHNHPSGDPKPSAEDIEVTHCLKKIGDLLQIELLDHIIVSEKGWFSFQENNLLH